ncbi:D-aminoacid aminotransferase-like PLP-dependent enzyme [Marasmius fiardii PR-910]|nr:D-aminoacid aminotransferase-like PLP-dependent enzyme [Marasmius fiardii PR-910]
MYHLLTSTRYDPFLLSLGWNNDGKDDGSPSPFLQLPYHHDRLLASAERHGWDNTLRYDELKRRCFQAVEAATLEGREGVALKLRITVTSAGELTITTSPVPSLKIDPLSEVYFLSPQGQVERNADSEFTAAEDYGVISTTLDTLPTPSSIFTSTKTTQRSHYDAARERAGLKSYTDPVDVILFNEDGLITETSIANIAFYRPPNGWLTPGKETGCFEGTMRRRLLEIGRVKEDTEGVLTRENLKDWEEVVVFNGVIGCKRARIVLH